MGEKLISLQNRESSLKGCYNKATQANMLGMPEQYLFSPEAKKIFPSLLNWTGRMIFPSDLNIAAVSC